MKFLIYNTIESRLATPEEINGIIGTDARPDQLFFSWSGASFPDESGEVQVNIDSLSLEKFEILPVNSIDKKVMLVFKNPSGQKISIVTTMEELLNKNIEDFRESLEPECTSSSCNNESQNFCDCGGQFEDYVISEVLISNAVE